LKSVPPGGVVLPAADGAVTSRLVLEVPPSLVRTMPATFLPVGSVAVFGRLSPVSQSPWASWVLLCTLTVDTA
jgi:hypothetical protein